ncbi:MAG TPA: hypothetical protein VF481_10365 [Novosphingobium sp.]
MGGRGVAMNWYLALAVALAALIPVSLIVAGVELRRMRLRVVQDLKVTVFAQNPMLPQLELAMSRYSRVTADSSRPGRQDEVKQWFGASVYTIVSLVGFVLLLDPVLWLVGGADNALRVADALLWAPHGDQAGSSEVGLRRAAAIAAFAFLGGHVFNVRYLIRQTLNQELTAIAFVRAAFSLLQGMVLALVVYHVGASGMGMVVDQPTDGAGMGVALAVAFVVGYFPDAGLARISKWARLHIKVVDEDALARARLIPLEIIDGIDHEIAFRLQESRLYDVQNLAVANPIELYAETPFTLLQTFDWVLQAQLCLVAGPQAFSELKRHKVRTIFDLERSVIASGVPDAYLRAIACVLLTDASPCFRSAIGLSATPVECEKPATAEPLTLRHLVAVISDDLHVHRLRALYSAIMNTTAGVSDTGKPLWLFETDWLPGDPKSPAPAQE